MPSNFFKYFKMLVNYIFHTGWYYHIPNVSNHFCMYSAFVAMYDLYNSFPIISCTKLAIQHTHTQNVLCIYKYINLIIMFYLAHI